MNDNNTRAEVCDSFRPGDELSLYAEDFTIRGAAVAKIKAAGAQGRSTVVFVDGAVPGDTVTARITAVKKFGLLAEAVRVDTPSVHRVPPDCPDFSRCGGCVFRAMDYSGELAVKAGWVRQALERIGRVSPEIRPIVPSPQVYGYRNNVRLHIAKAPDGTLQAGFYGKSPPGLFIPRRCQLLSESMDTLRTRCMELISGVPAEFAGTEHISLRESGVDGQLLFSLTGSKLPRKQALDALYSALRETIPALAGIGAETKTDGRSRMFCVGEKYIRQELLGVSFLVGHDTFFQINGPQAENLFRTALDLACPGKNNRVLDLYCGIGVLSLLVAKRVSLVTGIEINPAATAAAKRCAAMNGIGNAAFLTGDAAKAASLLPEPHRNPDVVFLDPPRAGCAPPLLTSIAELSPERVVYISCDPATLARDAGRLGGLGYAAVTAQPLDMFPGCPHVETALLLAKQ